MFSERYALSKKELSIDLDAMAAGYGSLGMAASGLR